MLAILDQPPRLGNIVSVVPAQLCLLNGSVEMLRIETKCVAHSHLPDYNLYTDNTDNCTAPSNCTGL